MAASRRRSTGAIAGARITLAVSTLDGTILGADTTGAAVDLAAVVRSGGDPVDVLKRSGTRLCVVLIDDVDKFGNHVAFGKGEVHAPAVIDALKAMRFNGILVMGGDDQPADGQLQRFTDSVNTLSDLIGPPATSHP